MPEPKPEYITEHQARLTATGKVTQKGTFEILCITAGDANGWEFPPTVLEASTSKWEGAHCFIDHAWMSRSVRDLAGQIVDPTWDEDAQGIRATLKAFGPGGQLLTDFGREVLTEDHPPHVGFSADVIFKADGKKVKEILKVISLDLVYEPARGGAFLRALNQQQHTGVTPMPKPEENKTPTPQPPQDDPVVAKLQEDREAIKNLLGEQERQAKLDKALSEAEQTRIQMCSYLLESGLNASKLPAPVQDRIRKQFEGKIFEAAQLQEVIQDNREMLSELTAQSAVTGPGRISAMFNETDKLQAAVDDMFSVPRDKGSEALKTPRLSGIRELYLSLTGDYDLHGGYHPDRVQLATTADFTGLIKNALNKIVVNTWEMLGRAGYDWWNQISVQEHFGSLHDITGTLIGTVGTLPEVAEGAEYTELEIGDSPETASFTKYGGYIPLTLELIDRDETRKLRAYARELGSAGIRKISSLVAAIFTANAGIGPTMADTGALFNATAVTTAGGHANLLTTALGTAGAWDTVCQAIYNQPMLIKNAAGFYGTGPKMAINPKYCLVPRALQNTAYSLFELSFLREATYVYDNILKGTAVPVVVP
jgi:hypothetical protein